MACSGCSKKSAAAQPESLNFGIRLDTPNLTAMMQNEQARALYDQFKSLHPNSRQEFEPTLGNLQMWQWHITEASRRPKMESIELADISEAEEIARGRAFSQFEQMPEYMKERYLEISALFPGIQFYACGSRVTGSYIEKWSGSGVKRLRAQLGKPDKKESDYDVCVSSQDTNKAEIRAGLPKWADLLNHGVPDNEKIPIPLWNFDRLPKHEHSRVIDLVEAKNWGELMIIHNQYYLSPHVYCCDEKPVRRYFEWAIKEGIISKL